jgi:hypothetical protein
MTTSVVKTAPSKKDDPDQIGGIDDAISGAGA